MASKKSGGTAKNLRDSNPKYLGIKLSGGTLAKPGAIIVRQRGSKIRPGKNVGWGKDHTLFALRPGRVQFITQRIISLSGRIKKVPEVNVV